MTMTKTKTTMRIEAASTKDLLYPFIGILTSTDKP